MEKKKICFIAQFPPPIHGLSKAVDTLYNSELNSRILSNGNFEFEKIDITNNKNFFKNLTLIWKSNADLFYFTISQTKGGNLRDLIILKLLKQQNKKCLVHLHGGYYRTLIDKDVSKWQRKKNYKAIRELSGAIVLGDSLKQIFRGMLPEEKIYVVPNCVDDQYLISDQEFNEKINKTKSNEIIQVLYLSNFICSKGYFEVLKLAKLEKDRIDSGGKQKLHFNFAGNFFEKKDKIFFKKYIMKNHLNDFVTYYGVVEGDIKRNLLKHCDVFILLSRYPKEGQPISILEAMGNGMFIVATRHAGIPDLIDDKTNGILVDKKHIDILNIYQELLDFKYEKIQKTNREQILKKYRKLIYIQNMKEIYDHLLYRE